MGVAVSEAKRSELAGVPSAREAATENPARQNLARGDRAIPPSSEGEKA
jgi:hypothetical protein